MVSASAANLLQSKNEFPHGFSEAAEDYDDDDSYKGPLLSADDDDSY